MSAAGEIVGDASPTPYQLLPRLTDEEFSALRADIEANGIRVPIDVDEFGTVIDGHHRAWIAADLGIECPRRLVSGLTDEQKRSHAIAVNVHRRNLTREQRRDVVARLRQSGMSVRAIVAATGSSVGSVARDLATVPDGTVPDRITGADGKDRPAKATVTTTRTERESVEVDTATGEIAPRSSAPRRPSITDEFSDAISQLTRAVDRVNRLADDDRFPRNADQVAAKYRSDLTRARDAVQGVIARLP